MGSRWCQQGSGRVCQVGLGCPHSHEKAIDLALLSAGGAAVGLIIVKSVSIKKSQGACGKI